MWGTFEARDDGRGDYDLIHGAVHGVRRVDGVTVLYASLGFAEGTHPLSGSVFFSRFRDPYPTGVATQMYLVDRQNLTVYRVLADGDVKFTTAKGDIGIDSGELGVVWGVFPELPASVSEIDVVLGDLNVAVPRVPVEDGLLLPTSRDVVPRLGEGWPEIPVLDAVPGADPAVSIFDLFQRSESAGGVAAGRESSAEVETTLDANVLFDKTSATLTTAAQETVAQVAADIAARGTGEVVVTGHTDSDGSASSNKTLSEQRAAAVVAALTPYAGARVTFRVEGRGQEDPVVPNDSPENMQLNRRVTVEYSIGGGDS